MSVDRPQKDVIAVGAFRCTGKAVSSVQAELFLELVKKLFVFVIEVEDDVSRIPFSDTPDRFLTPEVFSDLSVRECAPSGRPVLSTYAFYDIFWKSLYECCVVFS